MAWDGAAHDLVGKIDQDETGPVTIACYDIAMGDLTFRDFAGAVMQGDAAGAAKVLESLLALEPPAAVAATAHFQGQMASGGPAFMGKAMGLRTAVTTGTDAEIGALLGDCFGLVAPTLLAAVAALRTRYPAP